MDTHNKTWDAFISHASEDKNSFVRPLALALKKAGARIWYDEFSLKLGDSLSQSIDRGLARSRYGIVVLSPAFMSKVWPQRELQGLVSREIEGQAAILPIWHGVTRSEVSSFSPTLADKMAARTNDTDALGIVRQILQTIRPDLYNQLDAGFDDHSVAELQDELDEVRQELSEFLCPHCGSKLALCVHAPVDHAEKHWDVRRIFECGFQDFGGSVERSCPLVATSAN